MPFLKREQNLYRKLREKTEAEKEQERENERLKAIVQFNRWFDATSEKFKHEKK